MLIHEYKCWCVFVFWPRCEQIFDVVLFVLPKKSSSLLSWSTPALCSSGGWICQIPACSVRWGLPTESHLWCDSGWLGQEAEICTQPLVLPAVLCWAVTFKAPPVQSCSVCSLCRDLVSTVPCTGLNELMTSRGNLVALVPPSVGWPSLVGAVWELQNASCYERGTFWMKSRSIADAHGGAVFHFLQSKGTPGLAHHGNYSSCSAGFSWAICPIYPVAMGNHNCS